MHYSNCLRKMILARFPGGVRVICVRGWNLIVRNLSGGSLCQSISIVYCWGVHCWGVRLVREVARVNGYGHAKICILFGKGITRCVSLTVLYFHTGPCQPSRTLHSISVQGTLNTRVSGPLSYVVGSNESVSCHLFSLARCISVLGIVVNWCVVVQSLAEHGLSSG